jgi:hypothetical protein
MKLFSPTFHGVLDYASAGAMIAMPRMLGFSKQTTNLMTGAGAAVLGMSLLTRYPMGVLPVLPMSAHLAADATLDAVLIREGNKLGKKEPQARNAIMGLAIAGAVVSLLTRRK